MKAEIPDFLKAFCGKGIHVSGCEQILMNYKDELKRNCKRSIIHYYLSGKSAVPLDLIMRISENNPGMLEECENVITGFSSRANKPIRIPRQVSRKLAYLIGCLRDGHVNPKNYTISIAQRGSATEWLDIITRIFYDEFGVRPKSRAMGDYAEIRVSSKPVCIFFLNIIGMPSRQETWKTPDIIRNNKHIWVPYISGFFDAEGHCTKPETFLKTGKIKLCMHQNNRESLEFIKKFLDEKGIKSSICLQRGRKCYGLYIQSREGIEKFGEVIRPLLKKEQLMAIRSIATRTLKLVPSEMCHSSASPEIGEGV